jgi:hypothetical protein
MNGFKKPSGGFPAARRTPLSLAKMAAAVGDAAEVPATPSAPPATHGAPPRGFVANRRSFPEAAACRLPFTTTQYGFFCPPSAAMSGYLPQPAAHLETNRPSTEWLIAEAPPMLSTAAEGGGRAARRTTHALCCSTVWPVAASPASCTRPPAPPQCENSRGRERKLKLTRLWVGRLGGCLLAVWS